MSMEFIFKIPKSWSKKKKATAYMEVPVGDIDNLCKGVMDALEGIAFVNDRQVVEITARKMYGEDDCVSVSLSETV